MMQRRARLVQLRQRDLGGGQQRAGAILAVGGDLGLVRQQRRHRRPLLVGAGDAAHAAQHRQKVADRVARLLVGQRRVTRAPDAIEEARRFEQEQRARRRRVALRRALDERAGQPLLGRRVAAPARATSVRTTPSATPGSCCPRPAASR